MNLTKANRNLKKAQGADQRAHALEVMANHVDGHPDACDSRPSAAVLRLIAAAERGHVSNSALDGLAHLSAEWLTKTREAAASYANYVLVNPHATGAERAKVLDELYDPVAELAGAQVAENSVANVVAVYQKAK